MENLQDINESQLLSYFANTLSAEERREVEAWMDASEANKKLARDIYYLYFAADTLGAMRRADAPRALKAVKKRIKKNHHLSMWNWIQRGAAVLFIPLLISTLYFAMRKAPAEFVEIRTNPGMVATVNLPDGTKVWLNSLSYLKHPVKFTGDTREVTLSGEAYFSVRKDKSKRFIVQAPKDVKVEVLGTEFNMEAYENEENISTTLVSGSVKLSYLTSGREEKTLVMKPNEKTVYNAHTKEIQTAPTFTDSDVAWKDQKVVLRNTSLSDMLRMLSKRFDVEFVIKTESLRENSYTGTFSTQQLQKVLEHLRLSSGIQYRIIDAKTGEEGMREKMKVELY